MNKIRQNFSVLLPTKNRPRMLSRALSFYEKTPQQFEINILDSSSIDYRDTVKKIVNNSNLKLNFIEYHHEVSLRHKILDIVSKIDSEYVLMIADDDILIPESISRCLEFLIFNQEYSAASGRSYNFYISNENKIKFSSYFQRSYEEDDPIHRFCEHMRNWSTSAYSIQRTRNFKEIFEAMGKFNGDTRSEELYWYGSNVIRGKVANLSIPYMFRHASSGVKKHYAITEYSVWEKEQKYQKELIALLSKEIKKVSDVPIEDIEHKCELVLQRWINDHRPFSLTNISSHSMAYAKLRLKERFERYLFFPDDPVTVKKITGFLLS